MNNALDIKSLVENKEKIINKKKGAVKHSDSISTNVVITPVKEKSVNKEVTQVEKENEISVKAIINTTNFLDTHDDVHVNGIWDECLETKPRVIHLQEHKMEFDKIISEDDDLEASVEELSWKDLGVDDEGTTQALVFTSTIKEERNPFMFNQYKKGYVKNHSVGMIYREFELAINDPEYKEEYEVWTEYIDKIVNKDVAMERGYFFAVTKADVFEGSAVPIGSNTITPTLTESKEIPQEKKEEISEIKEEIYKSEEIESEEQTDGNPIEQVQDEVDSDDLIKIEREREQETLTLTELG